jgi:translocator protein
MAPSTLADIAKLAAAILICQAAALLGGLAIGDSVRTWYPGIAKPSWTPPGAVIGAIWTVLFTLMGVSLWLLWRAGPARPDVRLALVAFAVQWVLNVGWNVAFFRLHSLGGGLVEITVLVLAIAATIALAWRVSAPAGALLLPYIAWVSFAGFLNLEIWRLNR